MPEVYTIQRARQEDTPVLVRHRRGMFEAMGYTDREKLDAMDAGFRTWAAEKLEGGEYVGWLATDRDGRVVAGAGVWVLDWPPTASDPTRPRGYILNMFTEPGHRRKGLARQLVGEILAWARARGLRTLILHASDEGRPLYTSLGFEPTNEMRLRLA